jgi:hypothetical protein
MSLAQISQAYRGEGTLLRRVEGACLHASAAINAEKEDITNHTNRLSWAKAVHTDATTEAKKLMARVLENHEIESNSDGVSDATIQAVVDILIDEFAKGV